MDRSYTHACPRDRLYTHTGGLSLSRDRLYTHDGACPSPLAHVPTCPLKWNYKAVEISLARQDQSRVGHN